MSRMPTIGLGLALLCGVAWIAVSVDEIPNAVFAILAGGTKANSNHYADAIFVILCLCLAASVGVGVGWSLRSQTARDRETDLQRRLLDTKGRIPRLESGMRNRELHVSRVEQQLKTLGEQIPPLQKTIDERDHALRDRDRMISLLRGELMVLKGSPQNGDSTNEAADLDLGDYRAKGTGDAPRDDLEAQVRELETQMHARQARIAELMHEQGKHATRIPELEAALDDQRKRGEAFSRERERQDKWLDVLNDQLARAREANDKLTAELTDQQILKQRIANLEVEVARLNGEIADRERRLAASRFECATARTTITHLQAQLERNGATASSK